MNPESTYIFCKTEIYEQYMKAKKVLDIGCVHNRYKEKDKQHVFFRINDMAREVLGIDLQEEGIEYLADKGYNVKVGDAEALNLGEKFDVIHAGNLIEHLSNQGNFMQGIHDHLKDDGLVIITTNNAFCLKNVIHDVRQCEEHTSFFNGQTIGQLAERYGLEVTKIYYHQPVYPFWYKALLRRMPRLAESMTVIMRKKDV